MTVLPVANHSDTIDLRLGNQIILMYLLGVLERNRKHRWIPLSVPVDLNTPPIPHPTPPFVLIMLQFWNQLTDFDEIWNVKSTKLFKATL